MEPNHIYQYSLLNALMSGITETGIPSSTLLQKGNLGLGTFTRMNGELILLDSKIYRLQEKGHVSVASPTDEIPFATVINFQPQMTKDDVSLPSKQSIDEVIDSWTGGSSKIKNLFVAYKIDGVFNRVKARTVRGAQKGEKLSDLGKSQFVDEYFDVRGTVVGFRSPENWSGFAVAGEHLHFIDDDRKKGGHVLELEVKGENTVRMEVAVACNVHVELPTSVAFNEVDLKTDEQGIKEAEG